MPLLTLFTAPKPMTTPLIATIQRNAFASWKALGDKVSVALIGSEDGLGEAAKEYGFTYLPQVARNHLGTPLISSIFYLGRSVNQSPYLTYVNADIILYPDFVEHIQRVGQELEKFLIVGQRYDMDITETIRYDEGWEINLRERMLKEGKLHTRSGSDYFVYPRTCFDQIPEFTVGRAGWDNWMIYRARKMKWPVVDGSPQIEIIHQNHDYSHLPGGQPHYKLPETGENIRLAGGRRVLFLLDDATHILEQNKIKPFPKSLMKLYREFVNRPLLKWRSYALTQFLFALTRPKQASRERKNDRIMAANMRKSRQG
ncbi:MAG: hypothetical protein ACOYKD_04275 [Anaerolineaceae bacterium]|jgi:hypothetical protein